MKSVLAYIISLIWNILSKNFWKWIFVTLAFVSFKYAETFRDIKENIKILSIISVPNDTSSHIYLSRGIENNKIKYKIYQFDKPQVIDKNNNFINYTYNDFNVLFWIVFGISIIVLIITTFIGEEDAGWEMDSCLETAFISTIYCEMEDGKYVYMSFGRLIDKCNNQTYSSNLRVQSLSELWRCPKYQTKNSKRNSLLDAILK